jgi:hypothetical protein
LPSPVNEKLDCCCRRRGHSVEISYHQEAGYNALFDPVCDLEALKNTYKDGEERWKE